MKPKVKNWIVLIVSVALLTVGYLIVLSNMGRNIRSNVSKGTETISRSFVDVRIEEVEDVLVNIKAVLPSLSDYSSPELLKALNIISIDRDGRDDGYSIQGDSLLVTDNGVSAAISIPHLLGFSSDVVNGGILMLSSGEVWTSFPTSSIPEIPSSSFQYEGMTIIPIKYHVDEMDGDVIFFLYSESLSSSAENGVGMMKRSGIYVVILFAVFITFLAIYTFSREPFNVNKNRKKIDRLFSAATEDFVFLVEVDVKTRSEIVFFVSDKALPKWKRSRKYDSSILAYANTVVVEEDRERFLEIADLDALLEHFRNSGDDVIIEYDVLVEGERRHYQGKFVYSMEDNEGPKIYVSIRDITESEEERIDNEKKLMKALASAEDANKGKSFFLFNMSHDIRTPLNAIIGYSELAKKHLDEKAVMELYIDRINSCGKQLLGLIGDVLDMAKIESGRLTLSEKPVLCGNMMGEIMASVTKEAEEKGIELRAEGNACHSTILCDKVKVQKILLNVIGNAIKYTPEGGKVKLTVKEEEIEREKSRFTFTVADNGIGISEEFLPYIFNSFSRERSATMSGVTGTGLGMSITKRLVDVMGGTITVESQQGKGTVVTVVLEFKKGFEEEKQEEKKENCLSLKGCRVLLVEDNEINREIALEMLREIGVDAESAVNGEECINMLLSHDRGYYSAVLMDIQMPVMDGYEAARKIRSFSDPLKRNIPIIAMTANAFEEDRQKAFRSGMNSHISKPIDTKLLTATLQSCLHERER